MTKMLAFVTNPEDAAVAVEGGADRVGVRLGSGVGCMMAAQLPVLAEHIDRRCSTTLLCDDWAELGASAVSRALKESRADELRLPLSALPEFRALPLPPVRLIGIVAANVSIAGTLTESHTGDRPDGLMLGGASESTRLLAGTSVDALAAVAALCRGHGLSLSLSGALEPPDVPRLLPLGADELCFGQALCHDGNVAKGLDAMRVRVIRDLVDEGGTATLVPTGSKGLPPDRIFMRDWILPIRIGAYAHEHTAPQRVRFSVEADLVGCEKPAADMRDVVSYDLITDSIRRLTARHVDLVEALAEQIAAAVLAHPRVFQVTVTVEKLDLGPGALGCRITREKAS